MAKCIKCVVINREQLKLISDTLYSFGIYNYNYDPVSDVLSIVYNSGEEKNFVKCIIENSIKEIIEECHEINEEIN